MKKLLSLLLAFLISLTLVGCDELPFGDTSSDNKYPDLDGTSYLALNVGDPIPVWTNLIDALDPEDGHIRITDDMVDINDFDINTAGTYYIEYYVPDSEEKTSYYKLEVQVIDSREILFELNGEENVFVSVGTEYFDEGVTAKYEGTDEEITVLIESNVDTSILGEYIVEYSISQSDVLYRHVTVVDIEAPVIDLGEYSEVWIVTSSEYTDLSYTITDNYNTDNFEMIVKGVVDPTTPGDYQIKYTAIDESGNESDTVTRIIHVIEGDLPIFIYDFELDRSVELGSEYSHETVRILTEEGVFYTTILGDVDVTVVGEYPILFTYTDGSNVTHTLESIVRVVDSVPPVIFLEGGDEVTLEFGETYTDLLGVVTDNYDTDLVVNRSGEIDYNVLGTYTLYYDVTDSSGNEAVQVTRTINIVDTTAPTVELKSTMYFYVQLNGEYVEHGLNITDNYDTEGFNIIFNGTVDVNTVGEYRLTYIVTDSSGNVSDTVVRYVRVIDTELPTSILLGDSVIEIEYLDAYTEQGAVMVFDDGSYMMEVGGDVVDSSLLGTYTVVYSYTDSSLNTYQTIRIVKVVDNVRPVIEYPGLTEITIEVNSTEGLPEASCYDNYDLNCVVTLDESALDRTKLGSYIVYHNTADSSGNTAYVVEVVVNVVDTEAPTVTLKGHPTMYTTIGEEYVDKGLNITDNYDTDGFRVEIVGNLDTSTLGTYRITYYVYDSSGNLYSGSGRNIVVIEDLIPSTKLLGEGSVVVEYGDGYVEEGAKVFLEYGSFDMEVIEGIPESTIGEFVVEYWYRDIFGNEYTEYRNVTIEDTTKPIIELGNQCEITIKANSNLDVLSAMVFDNYDGEYPATRDIGNLDIITPGTYIVTYSAVDSNGNIAEPVSQTVHVIYTQPELAVTDISSTNKDVNVKLDLFDPDNILSDYRVVIESGNELYRIDSINKTDINYIISDLQTSTDYVLKFFGTYDLLDGNGEQEMLFSRKTISTRATEMFTFENHPCGPTQYECILFTMLTDNDSVISYSAGELYLNGEFVKSYPFEVGDNTFIVDQLEADTFYELYFTIRYDLLDGNGEQEFTQYYSIQTEPNYLDVTLFECDGTMYLPNQQAACHIALDNPNDYPVYSLNINGFGYNNFKVGSSNTDIYLDIYADASLGENSFEILSLYTMGPQTFINNPTYDYYVIDQVNVSNVDVAPVVDNDSGFMISVSFDQGSYDVDAITINGTRYSTFENENTDEYVTVYHSLITDLGLYEIVVESVEYHNVNGSIVNNIMYVSSTMVVDEINTTYIYDLEDFNNIRFNLDGQYRLMTNIILDNPNWIPIGDFANPFTGVLDGNGYSISGFTRNQIEPTNNYEFFGIFGFVSKGVIHNVNLSGVDVTYYASDSIYFGTLAGYANYSLFRDIGVSGTLNFGGQTNSDYSIGGLVGSGSNAFVERVMSDVTINVSMSGTLVAIGGICGSCNTITKVNAFGDINISPSVNLDHVYVGGISGSVTNMFLSTVESNITVDGAGEVRLGGASGYGTYLDRVKVRGNISSQNASLQQDVGGIVGVSYGSVKDSLFIGNIDVTGMYDSYVGGIVGAARGDIVNSLSIGEISLYMSEPRYGYVGGIAGVQNDGVIMFSLSDTDVSSTIISGYSNDYGAISGKSYSVKSVIRTYFNMNNSFEGRLNNNLGWGFFDNQKAVVELMSELGFSELIWDYSEIG